MGRKIIQVQTMQNHLIALDSEGVIYWRSWTKKGWAIMEQVPLPSDPAPVTPVVAPTNHTAPIPPPAIISPVLPTVAAPVVVPPPMTQDPA